MNRRTSLAVAWTLLILLACWLPRTRMPVSERAPSFLKRIHFDKMVHAGLFAGFAFLWRRASSSRATLPIVAAGVALAIVTELGQATEWVGRDANVPDGLADCVGVLIGLALYRGWERNHPPMDVYPNS